MLEEEAAAAAKEGKDCCCCWVTEEVGKREFVFGNVERVIGEKDREEGSLIWEGFDEEKGRWSCCCCSSCPFTRVE